MSQANLKSEASLKGFIAECQQRVETSLTRHLNILNKHSPTLLDAMSYSLLNGGKRVRPVLVYATQQALGGNLKQADDAAAAVEMIHSYSLIHDDLPAMDDDDLRRGQPTCHIAFDEATAILAGDALQTLAFAVLSETASYPSEQRIKMISALARASGAEGMVAGQAIDLDSVGKNLDIDALKHMHRLKTGALIKASVELGALCNSGGADAGLMDYAEAVGLAFQIQDDILDVEGTTEDLGKPQGSDHEQDKPTYTSILGLEEAKHQTQLLLEQALDSINHLGESALYLRELARYVVNRSH